MQCQVHDHLHVSCSLGCRITAIRAFRCFHPKRCAGHEMHARRVRDACEMRARFYFPARRVHDCGSIKTSERAPTFTKALSWPLLCTRGPLSRIGAFSSQSQTLSSRIFHWQIGSAHTLRLRQTKAGRLRLAPRAGARASSYSSPLSCSFLGVQCRSLPIPSFCAPEACARKPNSPCAAAATLRRSCATFSSRT
eukprot:6188588-Pleurochrysis_carterae.AAC.6